MKVTKQDDVYKASRITGPKHNYLGLSMSTAPPVSTSIVPRHLNDEPTAVDETLLVEAVIAGIEDGNRTTAMPLFAHLIEYVPSDTPDYAAYSQLAKAITEAASADFALNQD